MLDLKKLSTSTRKGTKKKGYVSRFVHVLMTMVERTLYLQWDKPLHAFYALRFAEMWIARHVCSILRSSTSIEHQTSLFDAVQGD
jgi:hypothetical protein